MSKKALNSVESELRQFENDIDRVTRKALRLCQVLENLQNSLKELNKQCDAVIDWDNFEKTFKNMFKPTV